MGPEILSSTGVGVCREALKAFPDSRSVLDKCQSASFAVSLKSAGSSQRPWSQVAAAARFCGRSDHGTLREASKSTRPNLWRQPFDQNNPARRSERHAILCERVWIMSRKGVCRNARGIFLNKTLREFCRVFFGGFFGAVLLEKTGGKIHPKIHGKIQIRIRDFRGQNPHCKDLPLKLCGSGCSHAWGGEIRVGWWSSLIPGKLDSKVLSSIGAPRYRAKGCSRWHPNGYQNKRVPKRQVFGSGKRGHYERGLFAGEISRISKISSNPFSKLRREIAILILHPFWYPFGCLKVTPKRVPKQTGTKMPSFWGKKRSCHFDATSVLIPLWVWLIKTSS